MEGAETELAHPDRRFDLQGSFDSPVRKLLFEAQMEAAKQKHSRYFEIAT
jgi:hypothetical protein